MKTIEVVAAVIIERSRVFVTQRGYGEFKDGWEFPGGKIEQGESPQQALVREIDEELGIAVKVGELIGTINYDYPQFHLIMHCYQCGIESGDIVLKEHEAARWVSVEALDEMDWLPADREIILSVKDAFAPLANS